MYLTVTILVERPSVIATISSFRIEIYAAMNLDMAQLRDRIKASVLRLK